MTGYSSVPRSARIAEIILGDEQVAIPIGSYNPAYGVTLSLPSIVGRRGVVRVLEPAMSADERQALQRSADALRSALARMPPGQGEAYSARQSAAGT
jgi:L-lactate dehydrogenase